MLPHFTVVGDFPVARGIRLSKTKLHDAAHTRKVGRNVALSVISPVHGAGVDLAKCLLRNWRQGSFR